ncbi:hypothetical protein L1887_36641 [Cichorium endivia]|nr:hypothetical protein L1887_36641 [Cichorium endivia]
MRKGPGSAYGAMWTQAAVRSGYRWWEHAQRHSLLNIVHRILSTLSVRCSTTRSQQYDEYKEEKKSKYGMGTRLAVGAAAGLLGGLAIAEGVVYVEDEITKDAADKVEDDLCYDVDDE